jgi:hypothetical protein
MAGFQVSTEDYDEQIHLSHSCLHRLPALRVMKIADKDSRETILSSRLLLILNEHVGSLLTFCMTAAMTS